MTLSHAATTACHCAMEEVSHPQSGYRPGRSGERAVRKEDVDMDVDVDGRTSGRETARAAIREGKAECVIFLRGQEKN